MLNDPDAKGIKTLDKDLQRIARLEEAVVFTARPLVAPGIAIVFMALTGLAAATVMGAGPGVLHGDLRQSNGPGCGEHA